MGKKSGRKKVYLVIQDPNIGTYLGTTATPSHNFFMDILFFVLNNHPGTNQIHIHRHRVGGGVTLTLKNTDMGGAAGLAVAANSPLQQEALDAVARHLGL